MLMWAVELAEEATRPTLGSGSAAAELVQGFLDLPEGAEEVQSADSTHWCQAFLCLRRDQVHQFDVSASLFASGPRRSPPRPGIESPCNLHDQTAGLAKPWKEVLSQCVPPKHLPLRSPSLPPDCKETRDPHGDRAKVEISS